MDLLQWYNLIFLLPLGWPVMYVLMMAFGLSWGETDADVEPELDAGTDVGVEADVEGDVDADVEADVEGDAGAGHALHEAGAIERVLTFFGVGKVPVSILVMSFCFLWAFAGMGCNWLLGKNAGGAAGVVWVSVAVAGMVSMIGTRWFAKVLGRLIPSVETYGTSKRELIGLQGEVLYEITADSGNARLRDEYGNLRDVSCRVSPGEPNIPVGVKVVLLRYDKAADAFAVGRV